MSGHWNAQKAIPIRELHCQYHDGCTRIVVRRRVRELLARMGYQSPKLRQTFQDNKERSCQLDRKKEYKNDQWFRFRHSMLPVVTMLCSPPKAGLLSYPRSWNRPCMKRSCGRTSMCAKCQ